jgi:hypothetical protein
LVDLRRQINDLAGSILKSAGIDVSPDGMTINSALDVLGALEVSGTLNVTGDAVFAGNLAVPNGSISNDALENPILPGIITGSGSGFGMAGGGYESKAAATLTVPDGFTQALVLANGGVSIANTSGQDGRTIDSRVLIGGSGGFVNSARNVGISIIGTVATNHSALLTGLTDGQTLTVAVQATVSSAWAASGINSAGVNGVVLWLR